MNICYQLPVQVLNQQFYETLNKKVDQLCKSGHRDVLQTIIVPKKSGRCILLERGIIITNYIVIILILK